MREKAKILICESNENFGMLLKEHLESGIFSTDLFCNGITGMNAFLEKDYALCIIDVVLPGMDGFTLAKEIKTYQPETPVIFLADKASNVKDEVLAGLKMGADDYFVKPYDLEILAHRIKAILNRLFKREYPSIPEVEKYTIGDYTYDSKRHFLTNNKQSVRLTAKENALLKLLCVNMNSLLLREKALTEIWGKADYFTARSMDVYITKLRKLFEEHSDIEIMNIHGKGYKLIYHAITE